MEIVYREATLKDADVLFDLSLKFAEYNTENSGLKEEFFFEEWEIEFKKEILEQLGDAETSMVYVAIDSGTIIGYVHAYYCDKCYHTIINELFVVDGYRGRKVGETLVHMAEDYCAKFDAPLRIEVYEWNSHAINFYKKNNYKVTTVILEKSQ